MNLARSLFLDSTIGSVQDLQRPGSALENPYVFDSVARDLKRMAASGLVEIVAEHREPALGEGLIDGLKFRRLRQG